MKNLELKFRGANLPELEVKIRLIGASYLKSIQQTDIFFKVPNGRLKLRLEEGNLPCLIFYDRPDVNEAKLSDYQLVYCEQGTEMQAVLEKALGSSGIVKKQRTIYLWQNIRIHLDKVEKLGEFIEFEAVLNETSDMTFENNQLAELVSKLGIDASNAISGAYVDLLRNIHD
jgi:adenylate cyclase, class 2